MEYIAKVKYMPDGTAHVFIGAYASRYYAAVDDAFVAAAEINHELNLLIPQAGELSYWKGEVSRLKAKLASADAMIKERAK